MGKSTVRTPVVEFARGSAAVPDGDMVRLKGVIFRAGVYPHQDYEHTIADNRRLVADFSPVPIDLGHPSSPSPLDGHLGRLESVELSADESTVFGTTNIPRWVMDKVGAAKLKVSASFDRATKRLRSLSLVTRPQIEDAELLAAFCACHPEAAPAAFTTTPKEVRTTMPSKREENIAALQAMSDEEYEAAVPADDDDADDDEPVVDPAPAEFADPEKAAMRAELDELQAERRRDKADAFAAAEVAAHRITPHERATAAAVMFHAMDDDAKSGGTVNFSQAGQVVRGTREQMVRAAYAQRRPHGYAGPDGLRASAEFSGAHALPNGPDAPETDREWAARVVKQHNGRNRIAG